MAAAEAGRHQISSDAVHSLQRVRPRTAALWVTFSEVALARTNYVHADGAARSALTLAPHDHDAWAAMSAGYAGLGWFDEAEACLTKLDRSKLSDIQRHRIGKAVNRWALGCSRGLLLTAIAALLVGALAVAIGVSAPLVARDLRLRQLAAASNTQMFAALADDAWRTEHRLRIGHAVLVTLSIMVFTLMMLS